MHQRNYTIDKVRMLAAIIVMMGHLLHIKPYDSRKVFGVFIDNLFSLGSFAVIVFFGLSGIALHFQIEKYGSGFHWFIARYIRLMPVYWICLFPPIIGCLILNVQIDYPPLGYLLSFFGFQAIFNDLLLPPVNGPLWSISVEIFLSASLILLARLRRNLLILIFSMSFFFSTIFLKNVVLFALPFFIFGFLIPKLNIKLDSLIIKYIILFFVLINLLFTLQIQNYAYLNNNSIYNFILVASILLLTFYHKSIKNGLISRFSQRSYALYAVHSPIFLFIDNTFYKNNLSLSIEQLTVSLFLLAIGTEFVYKFVDLPSMKKSRKYLIGKIRD
jgi:peptidoglycan/LPS O-acetylase OafA/YrhL